MTIYSQQMTFENYNPEYAMFVDKFKPKKTTDDCYTPDNIYETVRDWACARYGIDPASIVRPFWPGGDYERFNYPPGCFVLDNPPFSIISRIIRFYMRHGVRFLLFAPALSLFGTAPESGANYLCCGETITYANGAQVATSFVTSEGDFLVETVPDLNRRIKAADELNRKAKTKKLRKYSIPHDVATAARLNWLSIHGEPFRIRRSDAFFIRALDCGINLFGDGFLLSERAAAERAAAERAAAERAAAERAAAERAVLSDREKALQKRLGGGDD